MARIEQLAYEKGASEETFMEAAGEVVADRIAQLHPPCAVILLCGRGNNGGDGYVAGRVLREKGYRVSAYTPAPLESCSPLCQMQRKRYGEVHPVEDLHFESGIVIDALFGTGFRGQVEEPYRSLIEQTNASSLPVYALDIASGVNGTSGEVELAICATETIALGLPKIGSFRAWEYSGHLTVHSFGLAQEFIDQAQEEATWIVTPPLPKIVRTRHKYQAGYVVGVGGSPGMPGAALLSSFAALRAGAGIVRLFHPEGMEGELAAAPLEIIREGYRDPAVILKEMERANALFIGPGLGKNVDVLRALLPKVNKPCVVDADALTLIGEHALSLPKSCVLTPHLGELHRLLKEGEKPQQFVERHGVILLLKGAPTTIFAPHKKPAICSRGDPGMATAGSGDVLTGIIAAFLAQTQDPLLSAKLGAYYHGVAGEIAAKRHSSYALVASDITDALGEAFLNRGDL